MHIARLEARQESHAGQLKQHDDMRRDQARIISLEIQIEQSAKSANDKRAEQDRNLERAREQGRAEAQAQANAETAKRLQTMLLSEQQRAADDRKMNVIIGHNGNQSILQGVALGAYCYFIKFMFIVVCA